MELTLLARPMFRYVNVESRGSGIQTRGKDQVYTYQKNGCVFAMLCGPVLDQTAPLPKVKQGQGKGLYGYVAVCGT